MSYRDSYPDFYKLVDELNVSENDICCDISGLNFTIWNKANPSASVGLNLQHSSSNNGITIEVSHFLNEAFFSGNTFIPYAEIERIISIIKAFKSEIFSLKSDNENATKLQFTVTDQDNNYGISVELIQRNVSDIPVNGIFKRVSNSLKGLVGRGYRK